MPCQSAILPRRIVSFLLTRHPKLMLVHCFSLRDNYRVVALQFVSTHFYCWYKGEHASVCGKPNNFAARYVARDLPPNEKTIIKEVLFLFQIVEFTTFKMARLM